MADLLNLINDIDGLLKGKQPEKALGILHYIQEIIHPEHSLQVPVLIKLATVYKEIGLMGMATKAVKKVVDIAEKSKQYKVAGDAYVSLAGALLYTEGATVDGYSAITRRIDRYLARSIPKHSFSDYDFTVDRPLKVAVLSPDFCAHSLSSLVLRPLMSFTANCNHELHIMHLRKQEDQHTEQYRENCTSFTNVHGKTDEEIIALIREKKIDVLIDISGYTAETRLSVFMARPAPVQIGWISGMMTPTGLSCLPYFLTDKYMLSPKHTHDLGLPITMNSALTYCALSADNEILPRGQDPLVFCSFNNPCKVNNTVLKAWAEILKQVPNSELHVRTSFAMDGARIKEILGLLGVDPKRVIDVGTQVNNSFVKEYYCTKADIFLDSWPCSGCLTTVEALWNGVPVVSRYDELYCSRQSYSILSNIGLPELAWDSDAGFIKAAVALAQDRSRLWELRHSLRDRVKNSVLGDYGRASFELTSACTMAWNHYCTTRAKSLAQLTFTE